MRSFPEGGLHLMGGRASMGVLRAVRFRSRPAHSDQLALEMWSEGEPILLDPGTYHYQGFPPLDQEFGRAVAHNGPVIAGEEPMQPAGRFLWLNWSRGELAGRWRLRSARTDVGEALAATCDGYRRIGIRLQRCVLRVGDGLWAIVDEALGEGVNTLRAAWLFPAGRLTPGRETLLLHTRSGRVRVRIFGGRLAGVYSQGRLVHGTEVESPSRAWGWIAPTYGALEPGTSVVGEARGTLPLRMVTLIAIGSTRLPQVRFDWWPTSGSVPPFKAIRLGRRRLRIGE